MTFMTDANSQAMAAAAARRKVLEGLKTTDNLFRMLTHSSAYLVLILLGAIFVSLVIGGWFKLRTDIIAGSVVVTALLAPVMLPLFDEHVIPYLMRTFT